METERTFAKTTQIDCTELRRKVKGLLLKLNFRNKLVGTGYLEEALILKILCQKQYVKVMDLYEAIARYNHTKPGNVERAIRNTIADCHRNKSLQAVNKELGCSIYCPDYPPTNSDFITEVTIRMTYLAHSESARDADFNLRATQFARANFDSCAVCSNHSGRG